ncbi:hypothetical protein [Streptomyces sp. NPDC056987]|uniref:hypothetical protein n=1 Tax=Streptomyces sp. NPDC056987 TaxID=3345988 RepID=UPI00363A67F1
MSDQRKSEESAEKDRQGEGRRSNETAPGPGARTALRVPRQTREEPAPSAGTAPSAGPRAGAGPVAPAKPVHAPAGTPGPAGTSATAGAGRTGEAGAGRGGASEGADGRLFPRAESDRLSQRLQEALNSFVDEPRNSVEAAAVVLEEAAERLSTALAERPRALRSRWDVVEDGGDAADGPDTEELRLALQSYREMTQRLLRV